MTGEIKAQADLPANVESGFIEVEGGNLFYQRAGAGEAIILVHDGMIHHEVWDGQFGVFAKDHTVVRYDRRGYGRSPQPQEPYDNVEDLAAVYAQLGIQRATLMGMSAGGGLCVDFALKYPEKVEALVLVGAVISGYGFTDHFYTRGGRLTAADYADNARMWDYFINRDPYEVAPQSTAARERIRQLMAANPQNTDRAKNRLARQPVRPALGSLGEITVPTIIVVGEHDIPDVHAHAGVIEAGVPGSQRVVMSGAGHLVPLEIPDRFNEQVLFLLKQASFIRLIQSEGVAAGVKAMEEARAKDSGAVLFGEAKINQMGYEALAAGDVDRAIELFKLNAMAYPDSWNTYDSLGEAYAAKGEKDLAISNYEKSLELNPGSQTGKQALEALRK